MIKYRDENPWKKLFNKKDDENSKMDPSLCDTIGLCSLQKGVGEYIYDV